MKELKAVAAKCPTTSKVALRQFAQGLTQPDFAAEMAAEYRIAARMMMRPDFIEGVRAVLVDKDNDPRWNPREPEGVTTEMLDAIFAPLPPDEEWNSGRAGARRLGRARSRAGALIAITPTIPLTLLPGD